MDYSTCLSASVCQFWAWFVVLLDELCVPAHSMPTSFFLHRWCPLVCIKSPSPSPCLCFPFPSPPFLYPHRNVWYVDQQTECVIFLLSSGEKAGRGRGGEKQPGCHLLSRILHHPSPRHNDNHTPNLLLWPFTSMPSNSHAHIQYIWQGMWNRITDHIGTRKVSHLDFLPWINLQRQC